MRKIMIALAAATLMGVPAMSPTADARMMGGGMGGFHGGMSGFRGSFVGPRPFAFRSGFAPRFAFHHGFFPRQRFFPRHRFAFGAVPFVVGAGYGMGAGYDSCWLWRPTPWGWRQIWVCDSSY